MTIQENLQTIADSTAAIKQAIIDKGGDASGDISTWAVAINEISGGGSGGNDDITFTGICSYEMMDIVLTGNLNKLPTFATGNGVMHICAIYKTSGGLITDNAYIRNGNLGPYTLRIDCGEPIMGTEQPGLFIIEMYTDYGTKFVVHAVKFINEPSYGGTNPT